MKSVQCQTSESALDPLAAPVVSVLASTTKAPGAGLGAGVDVCTGIGTGPEWVLRVKIGTRMDLPVVNRLEASAVPCGPKAWQRESEVHEKSAVWPP